ncbi:hypothetical protein MTO96_021441 [Rhipicephalus appendiculatus]
MTARAAPIPTIPTLPTRHKIQLEPDAKAVARRIRKFLESGNNAHSVFFARVFSNAAGHWRMFVSKASRYAFRISHNVYFDNQLKTGKDRVVSSSALALSTVGILLSAFGLRQMGHNQKWIERG